MSTDEGAAMNGEVRWLGFWTAYVWLLVALAAASAGLAVGKALAGTLSPADVVDLLVALPAPVAMYGYARQRPIGPRGLWRLWLGVSAVGLMLSLGLGAALSLGTGQGAPALLALASLLLSAPLLYGLHAYAYRSPQLWGPATAPRPGVQLAAPGVGPLNARTSPSARP
jgi:hypothetical protein